LDTIVAVVDMPPEEEYKELYVLRRTIVTKSLFLLLVLSLVLAACGGESPAATTEAETGTGTEPTEETVASDPTEPVMEPTEPAAGETATVPMAGETATAPTMGETPTAMAEPTVMPEMTATVGTGGTAVATAAPAQAGEVVPPANADELAQLSGNIVADGSSTVQPVTAAAAEEFRKYANRVRVSVGTSGTGGGFEKFCAGETDISNASRPIEEDEIQACEDNGIEFIELPVAVDGLTVVANTENDWAECLTVEELATIWGPDSEGNVTSWSQVREGFPEEDLQLFGPGTDSGTFDYFTEVINGEEGASRSDYEASEDDNQLVQGVEGSGAGALGYFGYAYYQANQESLKALQIDGGEGCVAPTFETIRSGEYTPLSRPLFIYVTTEAAQRPAVQQFVRFMLSPSFYPLNETPEIGYVAFTPQQYQRVTEHFNNGTTGSLQQGDGATVDDYGR
jgi:phosphate binding protein